MKTLVVVGIAIMIVGVIGMLICVKKQRVNPALQPLSFVLFVVVLIGGFLCLRGQGLLGGSRGAGAVANELAYQEARGTVIGEFLKKAAPDKKLVIIADANYQKDRFTMQLIESLKKAYGAGEPEIDSVPIPPNAEEDGISSSDYVTAKALNDLLANHQDIGAVLFMNGLPENPQRLKIFSAKPRPAIMLIGRGGAPDKFLVDKIKSGDITGLVVSRPKVKYSEPADSDYNKAFNFRYIMIDKGNVDSTEVKEALN